MTLREGRRLKAFEKRVMRMFETRRDEVTGDWRKLHNEELHNLDVSLNIIRIIKSKAMRWSRHVT
jgi:hypothetical protein